MRPTSIAGTFVLTAALWWTPQEAERVTAASTMHEIAGGPFEASGVVSVSDAPGVLFVDDGRHREVFWMPLGDDRRQSRPAVRIPLAADVTDLEGITSDGDVVYVVGSQSKKKGADGDGLVRFRFDPVTLRADRVERVQGLKTWLAARVPELKGIERRRNDDEALNIEAIAWDGSRQRLLLGLRAPVVDGQALVVPLKLRDASGSLSAENLMVDGSVLRVDLGGAGIRSLEYDGEMKGFKLIAASDAKRQNRDFRLLEWDGSSGKPAREIAAYSRELKPEGITHVSIRGARMSLVVFDTSRFAVLE